MRYSFVMRPTVMLGFFAGAGLLAGGSAFAVPSPDLKQNYSTIVERNPFGLRPPPPPPQPAQTNKVAEVPKTDIFLTGIVTVGYPRIPKRAYMMLKEQNKKDPIYYSLSEGQKRDDIEVLAIDEAAKTVKIRWDKGETLL